MRSRDPMGSPSIQERSESSSRCVRPFALASRFRNQFAAGARQITTPRPSAVTAAAVRSRPTPQSTPLAAATQISAAVVSPRMR